MDLWERSGETPSPAIILGPMAVQATLVRVRHLPGLADCRLCLILRHHHGCWLL